MNYLERKFMGYDFEIHIPDKRNFNPLNEAVDVTLKTRKGEKYSANFITRKFIDYIFDKNKKTKECANGTYFCMPDLIIVNRIDKETIRTTIDDLIKNLEIGDYFKRY